jgi:hypothetical protein
MNEPRCLRVLLALTVPRAWLGAQHSTYNTKDFQILAEEIDVRIS